MDGKEIRQLGPALRTVRDDNGLAAKDLAERTGISASYISEIETGKRPLSVSFCEKASVAMGMDLTELVERLRRAYTSLSRKTYLAPLTSQKWGGPELSLREEPSLPPSGRCFGAELTQDFRYLSEWLVSNFSKESAWDMVRKLTAEAQAGDTKAARCAKALLEILSNQSP